MDEKLKLKIYYLFYLIPAAALAYLFWQNAKPVLEVRCDTNGKTPLCGELVPTSRTAAVKYGVVAKEEPVYFDVRLPRKYDKVEAEIEYSDLRNDIFEFGVARDEARKNFDFAPMENKILDNLGWSKLRAGDLVLYQRKPVYKTMSSFLMSPGNFKETLVYRADLAPKIENLSAGGKTVIDFPVKEKIKLMIYLKSGEPDIEVDATGDYKISITDAGNFKRADIVGAKDTVFNKISVNSPYVAILDGIKIGGLNKELKIYFAGSRFLAVADTAGGLQKLNVAGRTVDIKEAFSQYGEIFEDINLREVSVPKGNVEMGGTMFFVKAAPVFYPKYEPLYAGGDLSEIYPVKSPQAGPRSEFNRVNFILARYEPPEDIGAVGIKRAVAGFDISSTPTPNRKIRFLFSLPNAGRGDLVKITGIKLKFSGEKFGVADIWRKIFK